MSVAINRMKNSGLIRLIDVKDEHPKARAT
jgi:hypothetical protein